jgi:hypothetical protein
LLRSAPNEPTADENRALETPESDLDEILQGPSRPKPRALQGPPRSSGEPAWLTRSRLHVANRPEPLTVPFSSVSEQDLQSLEEAENTKGGLKRVLAKVMEIACKAAHGTIHKRAVNLFESDNEEELSDSEGGSGDAPQSLTVLECTRRVMVLEERIKENDMAQVKEKGDKRNAIGSIMPPGGVLNMKGVPGQTIPQQEGLDIGNYSNEAHWKYAPYLDPVRYVIEFQVLRMH